MPSLMLVDGNSLTYRAFYALPEDLMTSSGQVTNAVLGFTSMMVNLVRDHQPDGIAVAFDRPEPTFRHERAAEYKANRSKAPDILRQQMGIVREVLEALNIPQIDLQGYEADDILATLANAAAEDNIDVLVVTGDRDSYQLVKDPHVKVIYNKRGVSDYAIYDEAGIKERTGVAPTSYVQYAALRGDKSDNLPGVPGVGEKTAAKLINKYDGIDGLYDDVESQTPKLRQNLQENEEQVRLNVELMQLLYDAPIEVDYRDFLEREPYDQDEVKKLFSFLEFNTLFDRLEAAFATGPAVESQSLDVTLNEHTDPESALNALSKAAESEMPVAIAINAAERSNQDTSRFSLHQLVSEFAFVSDSEGGEVHIVPGEVLQDDRVQKSVARLLSDPKPGVAVHQAKPLARQLLAAGLSMGGLNLDPSLAGYLLNPAGGDYPLDVLLENYTDYQMPEGVVAPEGQLDFGESSDSANQQLATEAAAIHVLLPVLNEAIDAQGLRNLHDTIEVPLVGVLARMEHLGIGVDGNELQRLNDQMVAEVETLAQQIYTDAGEEFNVNSTKVLRRILFEKLELTPQKKTKTGFSTDHATLEKLVDDHPIIPKLLRYREVEKLRSTYGLPLLSAADEDGRIRATFRQTVARTGRLSSENPNLHNIPVRTELGREFRRAFVPSDGKTLLVADYNQIELRCIAHLAEDPGLIEAFTNGDDVHRITAARVFGVPAEDVSFEQRSRAKMVSYGLAYGMEAYGLSQRLRVPVSEAQSILDAYFDSFPAVREYMDFTVTEARNKGYTETLFGRRRQIPELRSDNRNIRMAGERQAMNAGIQGLAADIFKVALVRLDQKLTGDSSGQLVLQVHDEVLVETEPEQTEDMSQLIVGEMSDAFELAVPLEVNLSFGETWADAKE